MNISEDGKSYTIKSSVSKSSIVDLKFTQISPGVVVGKDGTSYFGTDPSDECRLADRTLRTRIRGALVRARSGVRRLGIPNVAA